MATSKNLLNDAFLRASRYVSEAHDRAVNPRPQDVARLSALGGPLPETASSPEEVLTLLDEIGSPATVATTGGRYFGFVTGGSLPVALATSWLSAAWDQNCGLRVMSPVCAALEDITLPWLRELLGLPASTGVGFVTGATMANFTCLAAARHALLARAGWDVEEEGLTGAPPLTIVVGDEVHVSALKALWLLGYGRARVVRVPADDQGRIIPSQLPALNERTIVCIQAGNANSGAIDPAEEICSRARAAGAWVHVDGAFGLWAAATHTHSHLMAGYSAADSWGTDCHKWLNVTYDSGLAFVREPRYLLNAMALSASYLQVSENREPFHYTPEASRRARALEIWAVLRCLGKRGVAETIERTCLLASRFADHLRAAGFAVLNRVELNQVLVSFGSAETTKKVIAEVQRDGTCWCGGTEWHGHTAMRISVSSWATTEDDVDRSAAAILQIAKRATKSSS
jgi:glutamate/tyrosine decarboxylase-like PLP-dependent enzyme